MRDQEFVLKTVTGKDASIPVSLRMKAPTYVRLVQRLERGDTNLSRFVENAVQLALESESKGGNDAKPATVNV